jgi:hypothetical protein
MRPCHYPQATLHPLLIMRLFALWFGSLCLMLSVVGMLACRHHAACHGTQWVGQSPRYLWYDIVAGPPSYGPGPGKEGGVFPHTAPHPSHYRAHTVNKAIVPDLAALVWSAIQVRAGEGTGYS